MIDDYKLGSVVSKNNFTADYYPNVFGSCGSGTFVLSENKEQIFIPKRLVHSYSYEKKYSIINAYGESMSPTINDGDKLIIEHQDFMQIMDNKVYVFCYEEQIYVKRLIKNIDEYVIKSDNPDPIYKPRFIQKEDINNVYIIGRVIGITREI